MQNIQSSWHSCNPMGHSSLLEIARHTYGAKILQQWDNELQPLKGSLPHSEKKLQIFHTTDFCLHADHISIFIESCHSLQRPRQNKRTEKIAMDVGYTTTHMEPKYQLEQVKKTTKSKVSFADFLLDGG